MHHNIGTVTIEPPTIDPPTIKLLTINPLTIEPPTIDPPTIDPRQLSPRQLIYVNLHWDQLSHLNLNLATIDPRQLILYIFPVQKLRLTSYCRKISFCSELSETLSKK